MNADNLMNSLEFIDDTLLEAAADSMRKRKRPLPWKSLTALAACLALVAGLFVYNLSPVPVYPNALFSAKQLGAMLPSYKGAATNNYVTEAFPKASMLNVPSLPWTTSLNVYRFNGAEPTAAEVEELMARVYPKLEKLYGKDIPIGQVEQTKTGYAHSNNYDYISETRFGDWWARGYNSRNSLNISWGNIAGTPLVLNGITLKAHYSQTDEQIINGLSPAVSHLEETFGLTLSEYKISKSYSTSNGYLNYMQVWLYDEDSVLDRTLAKYADKPPIYCSGDSICLEFWPYYTGDSETIYCKMIRYEASMQNRHEIYAQCRMITLPEAQMLLAKGYVFAPHACKLCMKEQDSVDFTFCDRITLKYVYGDYENQRIGVPFYVFYKRIDSNKDGIVLYAKTMVPAIEVSGLEEYFAEQEKQHDLY